MQWNILKTGILDYLQNLVLYNNQLTNYYYLHKGYIESLAVYVIEISITSLG